MPNREIRRLSVKTVEGVRTKHPRQAPPGHIDQHTTEEEDKKPFRIPKRLLITLGVIIVILVLLLGALTWWARGAVSDFVTSGKQHVANKEISLAQADFDLAIQLRIFNPHSAAEAFLAIGDLLWRKNQPARALDYYREAAKNAPQDERIVLTAARALVSRNKIDEAAALIEKVTDSAPSLETVSAMIELRKGNMEHAQSLLEAAAAEQDVDAQYNVWIMNLITGNVTPAMAKNAEAAAKQMDQTKRFMRIEEKYNELTPKPAALKAQPLLVLGNLLLQEESPDWAAFAANTALRSDPKYRDAFTLLALSRLAVSDTDNAEIALQKSLAISPLHPELWYIQGRILATTGDLSQAKDAFQKASELGQDSADFHFAYGNALRATQDFAKAAEQLQKAYGGRKDKLSYGQTAYFALLDAEKLQEAQDIALELVQNFPAQDFGYAARAFTGFKLKEDADTIQQNLNQANAKNISSAFASYVAGVLLRAKQPDLATEAFLQAIDWDFSGEVAKRANTELGLLNNAI